MLKYIDRISVSDEDLISKNTHVVHEGALGQDLWSRSVDSQRFNSIKIMSVSYRPQWLF